MTRIFITLIAMAMLAGGQAAAQDAPVTNPQGVVGDLSLTTISPILQEVGFTTEIINAENGQTILGVTYGGTKALLINRACNEAGQCSGLWMFAYPQSQGTLEQINEFNLGSKPARAIIGADGQMALDRYLIADYGVTRGTLVTDIAVFMGMVPSWENFVAQKNGTAPAQ